MNLTIVGLFTGLLLALAAAAGGWGFFLLALVLGAVGWLVGAVLEGKLDLGSLSRSRSRG